MEEAAIEALNAGADFLLLAAFEDQLQKVTDAIVRAVETQQLAEERLLEAAQKVEKVAINFSK